MVSKFLRFAIVAAATLLSLPAAAQYTGPIDAINAGTPTAAWGVRAQAAAYAANGINAINYRRASDNSTQNGVLLSNGNFDIATANTFAGVHATATCTISGYTATCTGASATPSVGDTITGAGLAQPCYATAVGTFIGGAGTVTLGYNQNDPSPCGSVSAGETLAFQYGLYVTRLYDQTQGNNCGGASCDLVQGTMLYQPELLPTCSNGQPCILASSGMSLATATKFSPNANAQGSISVVGARVAQTSSVAELFVLLNGGNEIYVPAQSGRWKFALNSANVAVETAAENVFHSAVAVGQAGAGASVLNVDGAEAAGTGTYGTAAGLLTAFDSGGASFFQTEALFYDNVTLTQTQRTNGCANQATYYGITPGTYC